MNQNNKKRTKTKENMRKILLITICLLTSHAFSKDVWVNGHYTKNGTWVEGHYRSAPDHSTENNYSTEGNYNPYTGEEGKQKESYQSQRSSGTDCQYKCVGGYYTQSGRYVPQQCGTVCK